jgi:CheY-like chemotaxis protein
LAEDNEINQQVAREILEQAELVVDIANNGKEAVKMAQENRYDAILMDIQMPEMSGIEAAKAIRGIDSEAGEVPIIAMTAHAMAGDREKSIAAGMNDHVTKPIVPGTLFGVIIQWIKPGERDIPEDLLEKLNRGEKPVQEQTLPNIPDIDIRSGLSLVGGNEELYRSLLVKFYKDYGDIVTQIRDALAHENIELGTRLAHTVKGVAGTLGAKALQKAGADVEAAIQNGNRDNIDELLNMFERHIQSIMCGLKNFVDAEEDRGEVTGEKEKGDPVKLRELLEKLQVFIDGSKPKQCKEILTEMSRYSWPEGPTSAIAEIQEYISKYKFKDARPVAASLLEQISKE